MNEIKEYKLIQLNKKTKLVPSKKYLNRKKINKFNERHTWIEEAKDISYVLRDYKAFYITITKKDNEYKATANGCKLNAYPEIFLTNESYETLEQAKEAAIKFADLMTKK
jgi:hypothetical protein